MRKSKFKIAAMGILSGPIIIIGLLVGYWIIKKDIPYTGLIDERWSIGIYTLRHEDGAFDATPLSGANNPVLTADSVTQVADAHYVADPFIFSDNGIYYLFFEVLRSQNGDIGLATSSDGLNWEYQRIVLDESFHLSYPMVFRWDDRHYMIPESSQASAVRLYLAEDFPHRWRFVKDLITDIELFDPTIFRHDDTWWLFGSDHRDNLYLYSAEELHAPWVAHPMNPIVRHDPDTARPGGNVIQMDKHLYRIAQDCAPTYGNAVRALRINKLDEHDYDEVEILKRPLLRGSGAGWNANAMHQLSTLPTGEHTWIAAVDGRQKVVKPYIFVMNLRIPLSATAIDRFKSIKRKLFRFSE